MKPLSDLGYWKGGMTPSMQNSKYWFNGSIPWVSSGDIKSSSIFDVPMSITKLAVKETGSVILPKNSVLIVTRSGILRNFLPVAKILCNLTINQDIKAIISHPSVNPDYITQLLIGNGQRILATCLKSGTTVESIEYIWLKSFRILLPPLPEQTAIATTLSDVDSLISSLDALISKKKQIKQGAMQELLSGKRRLPGFSGEWEVVTLFKLAEGKKEYFNDGDWIESEHITTDGIRFIQTGNIGVGYFIEKHDRKYISEKSFASLSCKEINLGDLLICRLADPAGRACVLPDIGESKVVTSVDVTIFRAPPSSANRVYLALLFSTSNWFKSISDRSGGTTHKRIARGALGKISITLPPLPEQQAIAAILSDMDAEITTLETRRDKTKLLKQGMMQELLTGRIRLIPPAAHAVSA